jgi:hypothetical protein
MTSKVDRALRALADKVWDNRRERVQCQNCGKIPNKVVYLHCPAHDVVQRCCPRCASMWAKNTAEALADDEQPTYMQKIYGKGGP